MRAIGLALLSIVASCATAVLAQSIESTYAQLCADGKQNETCDALRKAVDEKNASAAASQARKAAEASDQLVQTWGPLAYLVDTAWTAGGGGFVIVHRFDWIDNRTAIRYRGGLEGLSSDTIEFRPGRQPGTLIGNITSTFGDKRKNVLFRFDGEGVLISEWYRLLRLNLRDEFRFSGGSYEGRTAVGEHGARPDFPAPHGNFRRFSDGDVARVAESKANVAELNEKATLELAEKERQRERERAENWNRVMGAVAGALTAAGGAVAETYSSTQNASPVSRPSTASPGSYPTNDPIDLSEACSGFTEANYRTKAVDAPGDDAHLYAACGQAFELYHMYKNAIRQGYSEVDAIRTYNAHVGAAENAKDYYRTRRAN